MGVNAQTAVPAFVAGEVLTAAEMTQVNTGIPVFATTVTRDAAFGGAGEKVLAEGQFAYIEATNTTQYYDGAAWQAVGASGLVFITSGSMTLGSALSFDNCFSATYANYLIMLTHTAGNNLTMRLRASAADITAANYDLQGFFITGGAQTLQNANSQTSWTVTNGSGYSQPMINLGNPFAATNTAFTANYQRTDSSIFQVVGGRYNATTSADGFSILGTSATVTARVYGIANS
jgi:hypothetical protein